MRLSSFFLWLALLPGAAGTLGCSGKDDDRPKPLDRTRGLDVDIPRDRLPEPTEAFIEQKCRTKVRGYATQCGQVVVPAAPGSSETLRLDVVRVFSKASDPEPDPIVYLEGGPGYPGTAAVLGSFESFEPFVERRDLIVLDQRGTGRTSDVLACPELSDATTDAELLEKLAECSSRLRSEGVDLSRYSTALSAADVDAVRRAFGYTEWNLLGISYGTRLGLTVLRDYPEGVRSAVLDSVVPLQVDFIAQLASNGLAAFEAAFAACGTDNECATRYPEPFEQLVRVVERLNAEPFEANGFAMTGDAFVDLLFNLLYHPVGVGLVPWLVDQVDQGDTERLELLVEALYGDGEGGGGESDPMGMSFGMHLSIECAEEVAFTTRAQVQEAEQSVPPELLGGLGGEFYFDYCEAWNVEAAHPRENEPVRSAIPTLLLAGGFDPITPPHYAELVHGDLENSSFVTLDNLSHGASIDPCGYSLVTQFFDEPVAPLSLGCLATVPPPEFQSSAAPEARRLRAPGPTIAFALESPSEDELREAADIVSKHRALLRPKAR